jgi:tetratricopeptide (TPR) repeat protein
LAALNEESGKLKEAEGMFRDLVQKRRDWLARNPTAEKSLDVAHTLNHLASVRRKQGQLAEAESLLREAWMIRQSLLRAHPEVANSIAALGRLLREEGCLAEAEALGREELAIREKVQSATHPERRACVNNLASLLREEGKLTEAENLIHLQGDTSAQ